MRTAVIVTVKNTTGSFAYDVEIPVDITAGKAAEDIVEVLNYYKSGILVLPGEGCRLKDERTGELLDPDRTLLESGVWQGDILIII